MWWILAAAIIASITALMIAFIAYPWQKSKDHAFELRREQRKSYREFIDAWLAVQQQIRTAEKTANESVFGAVQEYGDAMRMADACVYKLGLSGSETVISCVAKMHTGLYAFVKEFGEGVIEKSRSAADGAVPVGEIVSSFKDHFASLKEKHMEQLEELLFLMRSEEFDAPGRLLLVKPDLIEPYELEKTTQ